MNIQKNEFARQWYAKSNYIPFTDEAISFSEALESRNYQEAKFIISQQASLQNPYWYRQLKRLKRFFLMPIPVKFYRYCFKFLAIISSGR